MRRTSLPARVPTRLAILVGATALALGGLAATAPTAAAAVPAAPTGLTATYVSNQSSVQLAWTDTATDETGFQVERCVILACPTFTPLITLPAGTVSFVDPGYTGGGTTQYRVRAVNASGASAYSNVASVSTFSTGEGPTAVLTATPTSGYAPLTVGFDGSASFGFAGAAITSWTWEFGDGGTATGPTASHAYTAPGTYVAVLTVRGGFGFDREWVPVVVTQKVLTAPSDLAATSTVRNRVTLTWTNPVSTTTSIRVERCRGTGCTAFSTVATLTPTATTWTDTTARSGTRYSYRLRVTDGTAATALSNTVGVLTR